MAVLVSIAYVMVPEPVSTFASQIIGKRFSLSPGERAGVREEFAFI